MTSYTDLAKKAIREYVTRSAELDVPVDISEEMMERKAGVFVTIYKGIELRGCIGTFLPTKQNVAQEVIANAISACSRDPRFFPIEENELDDLIVEVSVLGKPEPIKDIKKHDPKKEGIIVQTKDGKKGLLLPNLEGIDSTEKQIQIACEKGSIDPSSEKTELLTFQTEVHK